MAHAPATREALRRREYERPAAAGAVSLPRRILALAPVRIVIGLLVCIGVPAVSLALTLPFARAYPPAASARWIGATALLLATYAVLYRYLERRKVTELSAAHAVSDGLRGFACGAASMSLPLLLLLGAGCYRVVAAQAPVDVAGALAALTFFATLEEVVFRGILQRIIERSAGTWIAVLVSNAAFAWVHTGNVGASPVSTAAVGLAGVLLGFLLALTGRLWFPIAFHLGWNLAQVLAGAAVSGINDMTGSAFLRLSQHGEAWLCGGAFGPEGSVVTLAVLLALGSGVAGAVASRRGFVPLSGAARAIGTPNSAPSHFRGRDRRAGVGDRWTAAHSFMM